MALPVMNAMEVSVVWVDAREAEKLRRAIERSRIAMEHPGGADLETIVAETAYDYWPQRAVLTRARQRAAERISAGDEVRAIRAEERTELVAAIGRTQEALRGDEIDLGSIAREGSREYWAERRRIAQESTGPVVDVTALTMMSRMLRDTERALLPRERRRPWLGVFYDVASVVLPLVLIPPLLLYIVQGRFSLPTIGSLRSLQAFADPRFALSALGVLLAGAGVLLYAYQRPEKRRRVLQFGGALTASLLMAVFGTAYVYASRTNSRMDQMQATLGSGLLLALERSFDRGYVIVPTQMDRSMRVETRTLNASAALLSAQIPGLAGEILVRLRPESADYFWRLNGHEIPKGRLTIGHIAAYDSKNGSITLRNGDQLRTYPAHVSGMTLPIGSRVAAEIGADDTVTGILALPPSPSPPPPAERAATSRQQ